MSSSLLHSRNCGRAFQQHTVHRRKTQVPGRHVTSRSGSDESIGNLKTVYCDDFQCTSSPQVERAVRSFAKDIERHSKWTIQIFAENVVYKERGITRLKGKPSYRSLTWNQDNMDEYKTEVVKMEMADNETASIQWQFTGKLTGIAVSGSVDSRLSLNVLTGRIEEHTDEVKLTGNGLGAAQYLLRKWIWGQQLQAKQLGDTVDRALDSISMDEPPGTMTRDLQDPTKFFQQDDTRFSDAVQWALFLAIMWTLWTAYANLPGF